VPVLAFDCVFNRKATDDGAVFFKNPVSLRAAADSINPERGQAVGSKLQRIARRRYTWDAVATEYFMLLDESFAKAEMARLDRDREDAQNESRPPRFELELAKHTPRIYTR
jgi:hypothetical protein